MAGKLIDLTLCVLVLIFLSGCSEKKVKEFDSQTIEDKGIVKKAKKYTDEQYQNGEVALHEYVQIQGKISKTDEKDNRIKQNSRFILKTTHGKYQVINGVDSNLKLGDKVTVYGEYYGFIKAMKIDES
ncbi:MAG: hypothetical protein LBS33_03300 [Streptococcaceae bacterium]|jgi:RecG-like helicase|nr:hypothetical protein [Streptococcaceae bacterium]